MKIVPIRTPLIAPMGLKACEKFKRRSDVSGSPHCAMNGLEAVSRKESPLAMTNRARRKKESRLESRDRERLHKVADEHIIEVVRNSPKKEQSRYQEKREKVA